MRYKRGLRDAQVEAAVAKVPPLRLDIVKRRDDTTLSSCRAAGWSSAFSPGSGATGGSLRISNLAETLTAFVALASIQLALRQPARAW